MSRNRIQFGMGFALLATALLMFLRLRGYMPGGSDAIGVTGVRLAIGVLGNFVLGALMTLGIGLYAPCIVLVSMLGMSERTAFPIMMGSCAFLMPVATAKFLKAGAFDAKAAIGLAIGGVPAALIAGLVVKSLPLDVLKVVVIIVIVYAAIMLLRTAFAERGLPVKGQTTIAS
jgi:uncharacterized membrane protein YfcA